MLIGANAGAAGWLLLVVALLLVSTVEPTAAVVVCPLLALVASMGAAETSVYELTTAQRAAW
jgi:hypothetical protein